MNHNFCTNIFREEWITQNNIFDTILTCYFVPFWTGAKNDGIAHIILKKIKAYRIQKVALAKLYHS